MGKRKEKIYVIGHKNPDTDSICSAIAYADLRQKVTGQEKEQYDKFILPKCTGRWL